MLSLSRIRLIIAAGGMLLLALAGLQGAPALAAPAGQTGTGTISGRTISQDNVPLAGYTISAYTAAGTTPGRTPVAQTTTGADGTYTLTVPAGAIWVNIATADHWGYDYTPIQVNPGDQIRGIDFVVATRALPTSVPEATATALPAAPTPTPVLPPVGMPATGAPPAPRVDLPLLLLAGLLLGAGGLLLRRSRRIGAGMDR